MWSMFSAAWWSGGHVTSLFLEYISILRENRSYMRTRQTARETQKEPGSVTEDTITEHTTRNGRKKRRGDTEREK
ncbi:hypothetical protein RSOLAG1IB_12240 [Rhizoctonia solani AG-1 IB]|uniref:Uncharacterized protein n=1 Tax=Thanatephorus cucumeris (strain AG1-IB / isolate 7/3/14) TaxID=1108050 RepID=A0A0B7FLX4_THACB|nr:hypothetical protein RSOLAG1IB_12240 [Rhizoctonia solani AG-1 IB]